MWGVKDRCPRKREHGLRAKADGMQADEPHSHFIDLLYRVRCGWVGKEKQETEYVMEYVEIDKPRQRRR
jgi:hypothetical protein